MLLPVLSEAEEDQESRGPEEGARPVPALYKAQTYVRCAPQTHSFSPISPPNGVKEITALFHPLLIMRPWMEAV